MKTKILEVLNKRDGKYEDGIYYMLADEVALNELADELEALFALRGVVKSLKENKEKPSGNNESDLGIISELLC